jgi:hypothetical protein
MTLTTSSDGTFSVITLQHQQRTYKRLTLQAFNSFEAASSCASIFFCAATLMALTDERDIDDIDGKQ